MPAALRTFAMFWLPGLLMLLAGMPALLRTGQLDPRDWVPAALILVFSSAGITARHGRVAALWVGAGAFGSVLLFVWLAAGLPPLPGPTLWLVGVALLAMAAGSLLVLRPWFGVGTSGLALLACGLCSQPSLLSPVRLKPALAVISGLPLFWREGDSGVDARADAPIITVLRQRFDVRPVDSPLAEGMAKVDALLLAQPRLLSPAELVALDTWVRRGGRAVVLADPLLRWPSPLPLGDRRRPPSVGLLFPLLDHWGVRQSPPSSGGEVRHFLGDGRLLTTFAASTFEPSGASCRTEAEGLIARCTIGRGTALLVADADLIDDRLWLADPQAPLDPERWTADTPAFIVQALGAADLTSARRWLRTEGELKWALRWAILGGIFWAALGILWSRGGKSAFPCPALHLAPAAKQKESK